MNLNIHIACPDAALLHAGLRGHRDNKVIGIVLVQFIDGGEVLQAPHAVVSANRHAAYSRALRRLNDLPGIAQIEPLVLVRAVFRGDAGLFRSIGVCNIVPFPVLTVIDPAVQVKANIRAAVNLQVIGVGRIHSLRGVGDHPESIVDECLVILSSQVGAASSDNRPIGSQGRHRQMYLGEHGGKGGDIVVCPHGLIVHRIRYNRVLRVGVIGDICDSEEIRGPAA